MYEYSESLQIHCMNEPISKAPILRFIMNLKIVFSIIILAIINAASVYAAENGVQRINPKGLHDSSKYYSHIAISPPNSKLAFIAGQVGVNENGDIVSTDTVEQMRRAFRNLRTALNAAGAKPEGVVSITILMLPGEEDLYTPLKEETDKLWGDKKPTSTLISIPPGEIKFEINAIAVVTEKQ